VPLLGCGGPRIVHYHEGLDTGQRDSRKMGRQQETVVSARHCELARRTISAHSGYVSPVAPTVPCMHWTSLRREWGVQYSVLLEGDTEVDLVQADGRWKLCYSTSADEDWTVVDLGSLHNEGELLIAADDRLAELLE
jgi:hypothetical protein